MRQIAIYGANGHGKVVSNIARLNGYDEILYIDDGENDSIPFEIFLEQGLQMPVAFGVGINHVRAKLYEKCIENGLEVVTLIHPSAVLDTSVTVAEGTVVMAGVVINADVNIGKCCIINTSCVIEHDNVIANFAHISPLVACAGEVTVGEYTHIGISSCIIQGVTIGANSVIGAGSVVVTDIEKQTLAYGNPCRIIKEIN
ncbi:MAG: acetyltransferase [Epsilonproteobacteria bacterium]|nr:MAG: acetyltransferase [Campylobacterota bacterium]